MCFCDEVFNSMIDYGCCLCETDKIPKKPLTNVACLRYRTHCVDDINSQDNVECMDCFPCICPLILAFDIITFVPRNIVECIKNCSKDQSNEDTIIENTNSNND